MRSPTAPNSAGRPHPAADSRHTHRRQAGFGCSALITPQPSPPAATSPTGELEQGVPSTHSRSRHAAHPLTRAAVRLARAHCRTGGGLIQLDGLPTELVGVVLAGHGRDHLASPGDAGISVSIKRGQGPAAREGTAPLHPLRAILQPILRGHGRRRASRGLRGVCPPDRGFETDSGSRAQRGCGDLGGRVERALPSRAARTERPAVRSLVSRVTPGESTGSSPTPSGGIEDCRVPPRVTWLVGTGEASPVSIVIMFAA